MTDLFTTKPKPPLAELLRPKTLNEFVGQRHLLGPGKPLRLAFEAGKLHSFILWGPPSVTRPGWYQPTDRGVERRLGERLTWLRSLDDGTLPSPDA